MKSVLGDICPMRPYFALDPKALRAQDRHRQGRPKTHFILPRYNLIAIRPSFWYAFAMPSKIQSSEAAAELRRWLEKYEPVEREILLAREKRLRNAAVRREKRVRQFGDLCEATEGLAVAWRRRDASTREMLAFADGDVLTLNALLPFLRRRATGEADALRRKLMRSLYYERENLRRRQLAAERRRVRRRHTENPCPTREALLEAWTHVRDGREAMLRFGSLLEDLECYVDNSLRIAGGAILGRAPGIKGWLRENIPALALKYTTVMRYKAAAKKLRQIVELQDPLPLSAILDAGKKRDYGAEESHDARQEVVDPAPGAAESPARLPVRDYDAEEINGVPVAGSAREGETAQKGTVVQEGAMVQKGTAARKGAVAREVAVAREGATAREVKILRARAVFLEAMEGVGRGMTATLTRIDALLDPARVEEKTMLSGWRVRYAQEITPCTRARWFGRLWGRCGS